MPREYELKFTIDPHDAERLVGHPLVRPALRERQVDRLVSTYFDTPDGKLRRHRFGLRVRKSRQRVTHTLKHTGASLIDRGEWERTDDSSRPDLGWLRQTPVAALLEDGAADALAPRFTVDVTRTTLPLRHRKTRIEGALDQGAIRSQGLSLPLSEFELEVKDGRPEAALDLARTLVRDLPLSLSLASKSERGYGVGDLTWGRPDDKIAPTLRKRMTLAQAFESIVQACLHTFLKNAALIGAAEDGEAVHKARIALRHLRAIFDLFRPALRRKRTKGVRDGVKWLSRKLGAARDADVFQTATFDPAAARGEIAGAAELARLMEARRHKAHERLRAALASRRARLLYVDLLVASTDGIRRGARQECYRPFVRKAIARRRLKLRGAAKGLARQTPAEMHEVRKAAKMLRYDLDIFAAAPGIGTGKAWRRLAKHVKVLQKSLGLVNDDAAMREHVGSLFLGRSAGVSRKRASWSRTVDGRAAAAAAVRLASSTPVRAGELCAAVKAAKRL